MPDEAILAGLDEEPDAFAAFYRRHVAAVLEHLESRTRDRGLAADLCAETFAAALDDAHRFDPARGPAGDWLFGIARRLLEDAASRGRAERRARRRLGLPALEPGDGFVDALEEELVEAARFRASRRHDGHDLPHAPLRAVAALVLVAVLAALAAGRDGGGPAPPGGGTRATAGVCEREVAPELLDRVAVLRREADELRQLPQALRRALDRGSEYRFDGVLLRDARSWGSAGGVEFWAVPVVARGSAWCAPANDVCAVAVPRVSQTDAECMPSRRRRLEFSRVAPLLPHNAGIYGVVPNGVIGARVSLGTATARVAARENMIGAVLPFPYADGVRVDLIRRPRH